MKRFSEQLKKKSEAVRLSAAEKRDLKARLVSYMEYHPLPKTASQESENEYIESEKYSIINFSSVHLKGFIGSFAAFVLILVPIVAEKSVPGDILYPVKVNINEEIRSTLAVSPYAKVEWETQRLERRIAEARLLASEGKLTQEVEAGVAAAVKQHSDAAQEGIAEIRQSDSDEAAIAEIAFESALAVQSEVLEGALKKEVEASVTASTTPGSSVATLASLVEEERKTATKNQSGETPSYEKLIARIESETTRAYELFYSVKDVASSEEAGDVERRLLDIERKIDQATKLKEDGSETTTEDGGEVSVLPEIALLRTALSDIQKLISFMTYIDVRENVNIEELVPVTLTDEERIEILALALSELDIQISELTIQLENREVDKKTEKLELGLKNVIDLASSSKKALEDGNLDEAEAKNSEAQISIEDIILLLGSGETVEEVPEVDPNNTTGSSTEEQIDETVESSGEVVGTSTAEVVENLVN